MVVAGAPFAGRIRTLDRTRVEAACRDPEAFRNDPGDRVAARGGEVRIALAAYATARIDWEAK